MPSHAPSDLCSPVGIHTWSCLPRLVQPPTLSLAFPLPWSSHSSLTSPSLCASQSRFGLHSEVRVTGSVCPPLHCVPPTQLSAFTLGSASAVDLASKPILVSHSSFILYSGFRLPLGSASHFAVGLPRSIWPPRHVCLQHPGQPPLPSVPIILALAFVSLFVSCPHFGLHFGIGVPPSF